MNLPVTIRTYDTKCYVRKIIITEINKHQQPWINNIDRGLKSPNLAWINAMLFVVVDICWFLLLQVITCFT